KPPAGGPKLTTQSPFELSEADLDVGARSTGKPTPRPARPTQHKPAPSDSSEVELSLDEGGGSSELEVDLEPAKGAGDSDSEFELTLDDSGASSPLSDSADRDIFETDFEVPSLEVESGSEAVALDEETDLENSDFDLAL